MPPHEERGAEQGMCVYVGWWWLDEEGEENDKVIISYLGQHSKINKLRIFIRG
jgi:hypothetical protein